MSVIILEKIKKKEGFILKKTKELKFLKKFRDEIKIVNSRLENFNKNESLQDNFIYALIDLFDNYEQHLYELQYEVDVNIRGLFKFLLDKSKKLNLKKDKEFYWLVVSFVIYKVVNLNDYDASKLINKFDINKLNNLFDLLGMEIGEFLSNIHSFSGDYEIPDFISLSNYQLLYCFQENGNSDTFYWSENPELDHELFVSDVGEIVILDKDLFNLSKYNNISEEDLNLLYSKLLRLFANNYLYCGEKVSKEFSEAKSSVKKDKILTNCFTETMNKNLSNFATYTSEELRDACALGSIPAYPDLLRYLKESGESDFVEEAQYQIESRR